MLAAVRSNYMEKGTPFFNKLNSLFDTADRVACATVNVFNLTESSLKLAEKDTTAMNQGAEAAGFMRTTLSMFRTIVPIEKFLTGKIWWKQATDGSFKIKIDEKGNPSKDKDGKYIPDHENGQKYLRNPFYIAMDASLLVARPLLALCHIDRMKPFLGKHAKWMGETISAAFAVLVTLNLVSSIKEIWDVIQDNTGDLQAKVLDLIQAFLDMLALPFELGIGTSGDPILAIVGAAIVLVASGFALFKEHVI